MGSLFNSFNLFAKYKTKSRSKSRSKSSRLNSCTLSAKSKTKFKSKSKSKYSDGSKALSNAASKLMKSANAQPKCMFLVSHTHNLTRVILNETIDYSVISNEGNSFRVLDEDDDDDLPRNLLSLLRFENNGIRPSCVVLGCCGSWIGLLFQPIRSKPQYLVWDMETDSCRYRFPCVSPREDDEMEIWASGMGFDPSSGHYKLLIVWAEHYRPDYAEVFSMETSSWKAVDYPYGFPVRYNGCSNSININGFCYWIVRVGFKDGSAPIMSFDFAKDRFCSLIPLPKREKLNIYGELSVALVEFKGSLAAICCDSEDKPFIFEIWGWNARGSFWSIVSTFDIPAAADPLSVLNLYNNDKLFIVYFEGELLLYDHATRLHENLGLPIEGGPLVFYPYVKSCVGPSSTN